MLHGNDILLGGFVYLADPGQQSTGWLRRLVYPFITIAEMFHRSHCDSIRVALCAAAKEKNNNDIAIYIPNNFTPGVF